MKINGILFDSPVYKEYLTKTETFDPDLTDAIDTLVRRFEEVIGDPRQRKGGQDFPFIPLDAQRAIHIFSMAKILYPKLFSNPVFYDIGSGRGNILLIFKMLNRINRAIIGIEKYKHFTEQNCIIAPTIYKDLNDLSARDFLDEKAPIIYLYNPIRESTLMEKGINNVISVAPAGSLIIFIDSGHIMNDFTQTLKPSKCRIQEIYCYKAHFIKLKP